MTTTSLDRVVYLLDKKRSFREKLSGYLEECRVNAALEFRCIALCEIGELLTEFGAYHASAPHMNEIGFLGGFVAGSSYAILHVLRHAKRHNHDGSSVVAWRDLAAYVGSVELGCVVSAAGAEYAVGKFMTLSNDPFSGANVALRLGTLPFAFAIGLGVFAGLTYGRKQEVTRFLSKKQRLPRIHRYLHSSLLHSGAKHTFSDRSLRISGESSSLVILERRVPKTYWAHVSPDDYSLYVARCPVARYDGEVRSELKEFVFAAFQGAGLSVHPVSDIYACSGSAVHRDTPTQKERAAP